MSNHSLPARGITIPFSHKSEVSVTYEQNIICRKTLISRQLFAGHVVSSRLMKRKEKNTSYDDSIGLLQQTITCYMLAGKLIESPEFFRFKRQLLKLSSKCEDHVFS